LLQAEGTTLTAFVLSRRLVYVHALLSDRRFADLTISAIAYEASFSDLSNFNHAFRRRYGASPSEVRYEAAQTSR
jgi:AraC-like DNA-binding protein